MARRQPTLNAACNGITRATRPARAAVRPASHCCPRGPAARFPQTRSHQPAHPASHDARRGLSSSGATTVLPDARACTGANTGFFGAGPSSPSRTRGRHVNGRLRQRLSWTTTARIIEPGSMVLATVCTLSCWLQRRRRSRSVMSSVTPSTPLNGCIAELLTAVGRSDLDSPRWKRHRGSLYPRRHRR